MPLQGQVQVPWMLGDPISEHQGFSKLNADAFAETVTERRFILYGTEVKHIPNYVHWTRGGS